LEIFFYFNSWPFKPRFKVCAIPSYLFKNTRPAVSMSFNVMFRCLYMAYF